MSTHTLETVIKRNRGPQLQQTVSRFMDSFKYPKVRSSENKKFLKGTIKCWNLPPIIGILTDFQSETLQKKSNFSPIFRVISNLKVGKVY